jgi:hypothetical protein
MKSGAGDSQPQKTRKIGAKGESQSIFLFAFSCASLRLKWPRKFFSVKVADDFF